MILFTPFFPGLTDYKALASDIKKKGSLMNHTHRVICRVQDEEAAREFGDTILSMFHEGDYLVMRDTPRTSIQLSNEMFAAAAEFVATYQAGVGEIPNPALLYMDPTYRPQVNMWLDTIQSQFYLAGAPRAFGRRVRELDGPGITQGPLVISRTFKAKAPLLSFSPPDTHWRQYCRHEIAASFADTDLIGPGEESVLRNPKQKK